MLAAFGTMLRWFAKNDPLRRHATPKPHPYSKVSLTLLVMTAAVCCSYVAKLVLVVPLDTQNFIVSRRGLMSSQSGAYLRVGSVLGTGALAGAPRPGGLAGSVQVLPRARDALVGLMQTQLVSTVFVANATLINATHSADVTASMVRLVAGQSSDATCAVGASPVFQAFQNFSSHTLVLPSDTPVVADMGCGDPTAANPCVVLLKLSSCPVGAACLLTHAAAEALRPSLCGPDRSFQVRADTSTVLQVPLSGSMRVEMAASFTARSTDEPPFYTDGNAPRMTVSSQALLLRPAICHNNNVATHLLTCPLPGEVLRIDMADLVTVYLTSRSRSNVHLVVVVLAAVVSGLAVARRMFAAATVVLRRTQRLRCGIVPLWAFVSQLFVAACGLTAAIVFTVAATRNDTLRTEHEADHMAVDSAHKVDVELPIYVWSLVGALTLVVAGLAQVPFVCGVSRGAACSPRQARLVAAFAVRFGFITLSVEMVGYFGVFYYVHLLATDRISAEETIRWWDNGTILLLREGMMLVVMSILRWLEWHKPASVFWFVAARAHPRGGSDVDAGAVPYRELHNQPPVPRQRSSFAVTARHQSRFRCCLCGDARPFLHFMFGLNLATAFAVLIMNAHFTTVHAVATVVLATFGTGITVIAVAGVAAGTCKRFAGLVQFALVLGAFLCFSAALLAPWALASIEEIVAHPLAEDLVAATPSRLSNLAVQLPLLLRTAVYVGASCLWVIGLAFSLEPPHAVGKGHDDMPVTQLVAGRDGDGGGHRPVATANELGMEMASPDSQSRYVPPTVVVRQ